MLQCRKHHPLKSTHSSAHDQDNQATMVTGKPTLPAATDILLRDQHSVHTCTRLDAMYRACLDSSIGAQPVTNYQRKANDSPHAGSNMPMATTGTGGGTSH